MNNNLRRAISYYLVFLLGVLYGIVVPYVWHTFIGWLP